MLALVLTVLATFVILVVNEVWWRRARVHTEFSRKFVHILVGTFVAFWPYFLSANQIKLLSLAFLVVVVVSKALRIFQAIHSVQRPTFGEVWFAVVVGLMAFSVEQYPHIFTVAILHLSLADGFAALVGVRYGAKNSYRIAGHTKSFIGSATFMLVSVALLAAYSAVNPGALAVWAIIPLAFGASLLENIAVQGLDNLLVPLLISGALLLSVAQV